MVERRFSLVAALATTLAAPGAALAQDGWTAPRTPDGQPDLQGLWTNSTTTPLERPDTVADRAVYTDEEVAAIDAANVGRNDRPPPPGDPGTYNDFWWERGTALARTSLVIDPPDGRLPPRTPAGETRAGWTRDSDHWTGRTMAERCVTRGAPKRPGGYNNHFLVLQTPGYVVMLQEMIHEPRIIPLAGGPPVDDRIRLWMGDSRGRWEGDTLVVETTNFRDEIYTNSFNCCPGASGGLTLVERFTRVDADTIEHHYTVNDPDTYTRPWTASVPMRRFAGPMYEYACHEGNYGMENLLRGARVQEAAEGP